LEQNHIKKVTENRKARYNYNIEDEYEAGMVLSGPEVKSLRNGSANLKDSYASIKNNEVFVYQMHIGRYKFDTNESYDSLRPRKLLLNKKEIKKLYGKVNEKGYSLIPLKVYFKNGRAKIVIAIARGKRLYDKRETIKNRDAKRELDRARKER
jgi:SsrA-binding protein